MQELGSYLLKLSRGALEQPTSEFKDWALSETKKLIPFDSGVWGMGSWINDKPVVHTVHLHNLPGRAVKIWLRFQHEDKLARDITQNSNLTFIVNVARDYANTNIYRVLGKVFGIEHIVATGNTDTDTRIINTIVMYRSAINQPFTERERALKEIIFPHLIEAARTNWLVNLPNMFSAYRHSSFNSLAACDASGMLHIAMPPFVAFCREEWPAWKGPFLPAEILVAARENRNYVGESIAVGVFKVGEVTLLRARIKLPADKLGAREREIAQQIMDGHDYKTIALNMGISPATVKTHTTNIYAKLGINDKARLAAELHKASI